MDIRPHTMEMENRVLSRESAEYFNDIPIRYEAETENKTKHQNCIHPCSADELKGSIKIENCTEATVAHLVKTELVEFHNIESESNKNSHQNLKKNITVTLEEMQTETNIDGDDVDLSYTCEKGDDDLHNNPGKESVSNSDSDQERDPFADVDCDPIFSQTLQSQESSASVTNSGLINSPKPVVSESLTLPSFPKSNLSNARILKHNFHCKTPHLDYTLQCSLCLVTQGSEREHKAHLKVCAISQRLSHRFCVVCNKLFSTSQSYGNHALKAHKISLSLQCQLCHEKFNSESELKTHLKICAASGIHGNRFCVLCNKIFSNCSANKNHAITVHKISVSIQCRLCLEELNSDSELKTHLEICAASHSNSNRFCVPCNKLLSTVETFKKHAFNIHGIVRAKRRKVKKR